MGGREAQDVCVRTCTLLRLGSGQDKGRSRPGSDQVSNRLCQKRQIGTERIECRVCAWELLRLLPRLCCGEGYSGAGP